MAQTIAAVKVGATVLSASGELSDDVSLFQGGPQGTLYDRIVAVNRHQPVARVSFRDVGAGGSKDNCSRRHAHDGYKERQPKNRCQREPFVICRLHSHTPLFADR